MFGDGGRKKRKQSVLCPLSGRTTLPSCVQSASIKENAAPVSRGRKAVSGALEPGCFIVGYEVEQYRNGGDEEKWDLGKDFNNYEVCE